MCWHDGVGCGIRLFPHSPIRSLHHGSVNRFESHTQAHSLQPPVYSDFPSLVQGVSIFVVQQSFGYVGDRTAYREKEDPSKYLLEVSR